MRDKKFYIFLVLLVLLVLTNIFVNVRREKSNVPLAVVDHEGYSTEILAEPQRIISMMPSNTEILYALGLGERVVGVTNYCDYPADALNKVKIGDLTFDFEGILALEADLILATSGMADSVEKLRELGQAVVVVDPKNLDEIMESIEWIASFTGKEVEAKKLTKDMARRIEEVREFASKQQMTPKVFYEMWDDPLMTAGPGTFIHSLIIEAGGRNIGDSVPIEWSAYSLENLLEEDPDLILVTWEDYERVYKRASWQSLKAIKEGRVVWIDQNIISRPGPRIVDALEEIQAAIFPQKD